VRPKLPRIRGNFDLGRWDGVIAVIAVLWMTFVLSILLLPSQFWVPVKASAGLLAAGVVVYLGVRLFAGHTLEREPGEMMLSAEEAEALLSPDGTSVPGRRPDEAAVPSSSE